jgi:mitochondrial import inner membrane translocase subunit TIM17
VLPPPGLAGGTIWHLVGGARNAPSGQRIAQAISRTRARVPILGGLCTQCFFLLFFLLIFTDVLPFYCTIPTGSFAIWGTLFSICDCTFTYVRKKEDPWNAIMSGAATGGILAIRAGVKAAGKSALAGGLILAAIEGLNILLVS